jgi:hypothetical protein
MIGSAERGSTENAEQALELVAKLLIAVADELSGITFNPRLSAERRSNAPAEGRCSTRSQGRPDLTRYRSRRHNLYVSDDGAIRIDEVGGKCLLSKPGRSGRTIDL